VPVSTAREIPGMASRRMTTIYDGQPETVSHVAGTPALRLDSIAPRWRSATLLTPAATGHTPGTSITKPQRHPANHGTIITTATARGARFASAWSTTPTSARSAVANNLRLPAEPVYAACPAAESLGEARPA
jgi:hypothetical protein